MACLRTLGLGSCQVISHSMARSQLRHVRTHTPGSRGSAHRKQEYAWYPEWHGSCSFLPPGYGHGLVNCFPFGGEAKKDQYARTSAISTHKIQRKHNQSLRNLDCRGAKQK